MTEENSNPQTIDTGLACFAIMANFFEKPISIDQIKHKYDRQNSNFEEYELLQLAKEFSFKARFVETKWERLDKTALPAIAQSKDNTYFIIGKVAEDKVLIQDPAKGNHPEVLNKEEFMNRWNGRLLMMTCREFINGKNRKFDISWFIPAVVKYRRLFGEVILASFFLQLFALVSPLLFQVVIDKVLVNRGLSSLDVLMVALICIGIFETLLGGLRTYTFSHTTTRVDVELGASLFKHLIRLPLSYFGVRRVGDTVARVHELENIRNFLTGSTLTLIIDFFFTIIFFTVMFFYSKTLTLLVLLSIPFYVLLSLFFTPILRSRIDERFRRGAENQCFLVEAVSGVETVKSLAVEPQMQRRWEQQLAAYVGSSFRASHINNIAGQLVQLVQKITMALTLWIGASLVMKGELSVGQLIAFNMLSGRVTQPILRLAQLWQNFQQAKISIEKLSDILNNPAENTETLSKGSMPEIKGDVEFKDITFRYVPNGPEILKKMSFKVKAGQKIGFVGPSGSGKSTVTKLIQRLYIPESGKVLIDGIDISTVDTAWLRRQIGVVLQENYLFNKSVRENIALTNPAISMDRIIAAARLAGAHDFITELPHGYDTIIEERGSSLSGGQRQRIAIARALVNNPRILIFDEATSALDYESERIIQQNMASICKGRTVFIALKNFSDVVYSYLEPIIGSDNISMFTVVVDKYNFGQDNWNFQYKSFQKKIKKIFKGYDYIANVALDEFPRISFQQDGTLMTPHIHGIFFRTLTRWEKSKLTKAIKKYFPESRIRPFVVRPQYDLESAIQYSFKALFGGKRMFTRRDLTVGLKNTGMTYKAIYANFTHLKRFKIYDLAFAGGKGKEILRNIINDIENGS